MKKKLLISVLAAAMALAPSMAPAGNLTSNIAVTATILAGCTAFVAPAVNFGVLINPGATNVHPAAIPTISVTCASGIPATITLNGGLNLSGGVRGLLKAGQPVIPYGIDQVAYGGSTPWGDTGAGFGNTITGSGVGVTGTGAALLVQVFPQIPSVPLAQQPGAYADTVVATVYF